MRSVLFAIEWTIATTLALLLLDLLIFFLGYAILIIGPILGGAIIGLFIGLGQWLVLRRRVPNSAVWIPTSVLGFGIAGFIGMVAAFYVARATNASWVMVVCFALPMPLVGVTQWLALRQWSSRRTWWIVTSTIAWSGAAAALIYGRGAFPAVTRWSSKLLSAIVGWEASGESGMILLAALIGGAISGAAMSRLLTSK